MMINAVLINPSDSGATATQPISDRATASYLENLSYQNGGRLLKGCSFYDRKEDSRCKDVY
jgi:hypothetical protein